MKRLLRKTIGKDREKLTEISGHIQNRRNNKTAKKYKRLSKNGVIPRKYLCRKYLVEQYKAYLGLTGDMVFSLEATSEEEAAQKAMDEAVATLRNEKTDGRWFPNFIKPEVVVINGKRYDAPHEYTKLRVNRGTAVSK